ncbi:pentapeptide repeat-containing protein [Ralstonia pseudosolanacearum]|uniref:pentapeptide repeat-containing protein n=1 Tax=Ralstonia pseudosolanacearum TaxID=1310165 RepID=UPI000A6C55E5|nr:pentapeptide repeat-containing protein [Ralstonia pseudosolanacearum]MDO3578256.1 pentapeptide repeat-containing protein [Ralstonia pseudosolanacearum]MDO3587564.1 pentapeptide repeat-containing protein [Ralstonia pseudosolanacearum]
MTRSAQYTATIDDGQSAQELVDRWKSPALAEQAEAIREAIAKGEDLPVNVPMVTAKFAGAAIPLADLRGIDLSRLTLKKVDLSYCCFERANFTDTKFIGTHVQYSSFENAKLDGVVWQEVQASPIFADSASFRNAHIENSFLMGASLNGADFGDAELSNTALVGSTFEHASLDHANVLLALDISETVLTDSSRLRHSLQKSIGKPRWIQSASAQSPGNKLYISLVLDGIKKQLSDIASHVDDINARVGTVVHKLNPFLAEVAVFSTSHQSSFSIYKNHLHLNQEIKSKSQERQGYENKVYAMYSTGKIKADIYEVEIKRGAVDLGDTVQLERVRSIKRRKSTKAYSSSRNELPVGTTAHESLGHQYKISKVIEKRTVQSSSATRQSARDISVKRIRGLAAKKTGKYARG